MTGDAEDNAGSATYHKHLPDLGIPRFQIMKQQDAHEYAEEFINKSHQPPWLYALYKHWRSLFEEPFKGVTNDGTSVAGQPYILSRSLLTRHR